MMRLSRGRFGSFRTGRFSAKRLSGGSRRDLRCEKVMMDKRDEKIWFASIDLLFLFVQRAWLLLEKKKSCRYRLHIRNQVLKAYL